MKKNIVIPALLLLALFMLPAAAQADAEVLASCTHSAGWNPGSESGHVCADCGEVFSHSLSTKTTAPTCLSVGYTMDVCTVCGWQGAQYDIRPADPNAHVWGDWTTVREATCTAAGERVHSCTICAETDSQPTALAEHKLQAQIHEPSCVEDGYTVYVCTVCSYEGEKTDIVARSAAYHRWGEFEVTLEPTCDSAGSKERACSVCGAKHRQEIAALGHKGKTVTVEAGCEDGYTVELCSVCGEEIGERTNIVPGSHEWSKWTMEKEVGCTEDGRMTRKCFVCQMSEEKSLPALGHDFKEGVCPPTCVSDGYTAVVCTRCGEQDGEIYDIVPAGEEYHVWDEDRWEKKLEPTCTEWGLYYQGCKYCDVMQKVPIMPKGHKGETRVFEADFAHDGYSVEICTVCGGEACPRYDFVPAGMYSVQMQETQVSDLEIPGAESIILYTAVSDDGEIAEILELRLDASGTVEIDFEDEWFAAHHVVRVVINSAGVSVQAQAEGVVRMETAGAQEPEGVLITVLTNLPNDGFGEEAGSYRRGVYSAKLLPESELVLRGRCLTISALKGEGTLLVVSAGQD